MMAAPTWILFLYQLPSHPSTQRVYVWRRLKSCGALYLQNSVCLLPNRTDVLRQLEAVRGEIEARKGRARLLPVRLLESKGHAEVLRLFQQQSDEEYTEFLGRCADFHKELVHERARENFTFAELEENEVELEKLRSWLPKIRGRDFHGAATAKKAARALVACEADFARFSKQVGDAQGLGGRTQRRAPVDRRRTPA
jgi:hypothetical protein